ncbi:MarR family winged helix-turn-helix transcriptional regulator [Cellulomonas fengjieae]|uniref:Winged helix-turn-helix transcriptional regulator n=1 Tax=Cellulomonas fengjieae TaxID=2819978 RepID=A0ABS3SDX6_9CELL|nr:MarR family winged helix-turn-helix transcriptional regulator [Cellulomonas fengjieae]MBO3083949.1 winged helix-turn-helix transcriptional regulator [Cellulomonas fengjieae]MBO3101300.1 winged helix-turn-helix transcriptional regulator [Cellulomonas fengjieae]QVI64777.1 winged helix-turn-helix transcriptional regulator [Cellulomonas fengjieae]
MPAGAGAVLIDLVRVETVLYNTVDARLKDAGGLTLPQLEVLSVIRDVPGCRVLDVSLTISITVGAASKAVDRLQEQGWCRRTVDPDDRRSSVLSLTTLGSAAVDQAAPVFEAAAADALGALLPAHDLEHLARTLRSARAVLQPGVDRAAGHPHAQRGPAGP